MKKRKELREYAHAGKQYAYILDYCLNTDGNYEATDEEKIDNFISCFQNEYNYEWNYHQWPNLTERIAQYLMGLHSCCTVAFETYYIIQIGKEWGYCKTKQQENRFVENWWQMIAVRLQQIWNYYHPNESLLQKLNY